MTGKGKPNLNRDRLNVIDEPGLYRLILRSDKPAAKPFRKWVTSEVLPTIRKTGSCHASRKPESLAATSCFSSFIFYLNSIKKGRVGQDTACIPAPSHNVRLC